MEDIKNNKLPKAERLYLRDHINDLFQEGKAFIAYPYRVIYLLSDTPLMARAEVMVSVPKKRFKRAVKRNRIKRLTREAYRLNKHGLIAALQENNMYLRVAFTIISDDMPDYPKVEKGINKALTKLIALL